MVSVIYVFVEFVASKPGGFCEKKKKTLMKHSHLKVHLLTFSGTFNRVTVSLVVMEMYL